MFRHSGLRLAVFLVGLGIAGGNVSAMMQPDQPGNNNNNNNFFQTPPRALLVDEAREIIKRIKSRRQFSLNNNNNYDSRNDNNNNNNLISQQRATDWAESDDEQDDLTLDERKEYNKELHAACMLRLKRFLNSLENESLMLDATARYHCSTNMIASLNQQYNALRKRVPGENALQQGEKTISPINLGYAPSLIMKKYIAESRVQFEDLNADMNTEIPSPGAMPALLQNIGNNNNNNQHHHFQQQQQQQQQLSTPLNGQNQNVQNVQGLNQNSNSNIRVNIFGGLNQQNSRPAYRRLFQEVENQQNNQNQNQISSFVQEDNRFQQQQQQRKQNQGDNVEYSPEISQRPVFTNFQEDLSQLKQPLLFQNAKPQQENQNIFQNNVSNNNISVLPKKLFNDAKEEEKISLEDKKNADVWYIEKNNQQKVEKNQLKQQVQNNLFDDTSLVSIFKNNAPNLEGQGLLFQNNPLQSNLSSNQQSFFFQQDHVQQQQQQQQQQQKSNKVLFGMGKQKVKGGLFQKLDEKKENQSKVLNFSAIKPSKKNNNDNNNNNNNNPMDLE